MNAPTPAAHLRRGTETGIEHEGRFIPRCLVGQLPPKLTEALVGNCPREMPILEHTGYVQVLNANDSIGENQRRGQFMQRIFAQTSYAVMGFG